MNNIKKQLLTNLRKLQKYIPILVFMIFAGMCGYIVWTSGQQALREPAEGAILDQVSSSSRPNLDDNAAETLRSLEDQNIEVKALFEESRNNPFVE